MRCIARILGAINARMGSPLQVAELEDAAQEVLLIAWGKLSTYEGRGSLESWIYPICRFELLARLRRRRMRESIEGTGETVIEGLPERVDPGESVDVEALHLALARLGAQEREIITLRYLDGDSIEDIAARFGLSHSAARKRCYRALLDLRRAIARGRREP